LRRASAVGPGARRARRTVLPASPARGGPCRWITRAACRLAGQQPVADQPGQRLGVRDVGNVAWFKNTRFRVTHGISARTLIGPALERVYASPWLPCWGFSSARTACTPEV